MNRRGRTEAAAIRAQGKPLLAYRRRLLQQPGDSSLIPPENAPGLFGKALSWLSEVWRVVGSIPVITRAIASNDPIRRLSDTAAVKKLPPEWLQLAVFVLTYPLIFDSGREDVGELTTPIQAAAEGRLGYMLPAICAAVVSVIWTLLGSILIAGAARTTFLGARRVLTACAFMTFVALAPQTLMSFTPKRWGWAEDDDLLGITLALLLLVGALFSCGLVRMVTRTQPGRGVDPVLRLIATTSRAVLLAGLGFILPLSLFLSVTTVANDLQGLDREIQRWADELIEEPTTALAQGGRCNVPEGGATLLDCKLTFASKAGTRVIDLKDYLVGLSVAIPVEVGFAGLTTKVEYASIAPFATAADGWNIKTLDGKLFATVSATVPGVVELTVPETACEAIKRVDWLERRALFIQITATDLTRRRPSREARTDAGGQILVWRVHPMPMIDLIERCAAMPPHYDYGSLLELYEKE